MMDGNQAAAAHELESLHDRVGVVLDRIERGEEAGVIEAAVEGALREAPGHEVERILFDFARVGLALEQLGLAAPSAAVFAGCQAARPRVEALRAESSGLDRTRTPVHTWSAGSVRASHVEARRPEGAVPLNRLGVPMSFRR